MLASSREGEEAEFLKQIQALALVGRAPAATKNEVTGAPSPAVQWLIVPRHPQRFDAVADAVRAAGLSVSRRSAWAAAPEPADVWLGDSLGEMAAYYALADVALLGGSFAPLGGQNLIEAAACGCPVLMGPHTFNFAQATEDALAAGAARRVESAEQLATAFVALQTDTAARAAMRAAGLAFAAAHRGATGRTLDFIAPPLGPATR